MHWEYLLSMLEYHLLWQLFDFDVHLLQVKVISRLSRRCILLLHFLQHMLICSHISSVNPERIGCLITWLPWIKPFGWRRFVSELIKSVDQLTEIRLAFLQPILLIILLSNKLIRDSQNDQGPLLLFYSIYYLIWSHRRRVHFWLICHHFQSIFGRQL